MIAFASAMILVLLVLGAPVYVFLGLPGALAIALFTDLPLETVAARVFGQLDGETLVAIPLFILLGNILIATSAARYLVEFLDTLVRHIRGGLALVAVLAAVFFAGITGSSMAEAAILASALGKPMAAAGYERRFTAGVLAAGSTLGILIPPSIPMLLFAAVTGESTGKLFLAGLGPGLVLGAFLAIYVVVRSARAGYGRSEAATWTERRVKFLRALPVLTIPVFIVLSLYLGLATATETGAVAAALGLLTMIVYREFSLPLLVRILTSTARSSAMLLLIVGTSAIFSFVLTYSRVPQGATQFAAELDLGAVVFLMAMNVLFLVLGVVLEPPPIIFITLPIIFPILATVGVDPVHFAVVMMVNMQLAQISPPIGMSLYAVSSLAGIPVDEVFSGVMPFMGLLILGLLLITYVPGISLMFVR